MTSVPTTSQFKSATTPSGKRAVEAWSAVWLSGEREVAIVAPTLEAWSAVWLSGEREVAIVAPTLEALKVLYDDLTGEALDIALAQHVWIVAFSTPEDAPSTKPAPANIPCSVKDCKTPASFIVNRTAFCMEHKP